MIRRILTVVFCSIAYSCTLTTVARSSTVGHEVPNGTNQQLSSPGSIEQKLPTAKVSLRPEASPGKTAIHLASPKDVRLDNDVPSLRVSTVGPDTVVVGKPATYVVSLANLSRFPARGVVVGISLPTWVQLKDHQTTTGDVNRPTEPAKDLGHLLWNVENVSGLAGQDLSLTIVPRAGKPFELNVDLSVRPRTSTSRIAVREPKLNVELAGPDDFVLGDSATWKIAVRNPGTGDAHDVRVDVFSGESKLASQKIGTIEAGVQRVVDLKLQPSVAGPGKLRAVGVGELSLRSEVAKPYLVRRSNVRVELLGPHFEYAGMETTYDVRVHNTGNAAANNVQLTFLMPPNFQYNGGLPEPTVTTTGLGWNVPNIDPGADVVFGIKCQALGGGDHKLAVKALTKDGQEATESIITHVESVADLKLEVFDPKGPRPVGSETEYEIHVTNRGTDVARQISVIAVCSPEIEPIDVTGNAAIKSGQIFFRPIGNLQSGQKIVHKITVKAHKEGSHGFRVVVQCFDPDTRLASEETTRFFVRPPARIAAKPAPARTR